MSLVSRSFVPSCVRLRSGNVRLQTLCGSTLQTTHIWPTTMQLGRFKRRVKLLVVNEISLPSGCQGILGVDILQATKCILNFVACEMRIGGERIPLTCENADVSSVLSDECPAEESVRAIYLQSSQDFIIPPRTEAMISTAASASTISEGIVTPMGHHLPKGLLIAKSVNRNYDGTVFVRVANVADHSVVVPADTSVALFEEAECLDESKLDDNVLPECVSDLLLRSQELVPPDQNQAVEEFLWEFRDVFSTAPDDLGRTHIVQHRIDVGSARPIKQSPRRMPLAKHEESRKIIDDMLRQGVIEPSSSPWASPIVMVRKKDGSTRFCVDYRRLNAVTIKDSFPLPRIDDTLDAVAESVWYSTLDCQSGYWQVEVHPDDREKTAFATRDGLWQFTVMSFGLTNAPATFERLMSTVLRGLPMDRCLIYLDDILVHGKTFADMITNLRSVFLRLRASGLKLNPSKCNLFRKEVQFLGHVLSSKGISPDPTKIEAISNWPTPTNLTDAHTTANSCPNLRRLLVHYIS